MESLGQGMGIGTGWDLNKINLAPININIEGGLATSAEIGRAVVDAIKQYTNVSGPADIAVA
jgi:succinyl-CoA synthetase beta subunit